MAAAASGAAARRCEQVPREFALSLWPERVGASVVVAIPIQGGKTLTFAEEKFRDWIWTPGYGGRPGAVDLWRDTSVGWTPVRVEREMLVAYVYERERLRAEDLAELARVATGEAPVE